MMMVILNTNTQCKHYLRKRKVTKMGIFDRLIFIYQYYSNSRRYMPIASIKM